MEEKSGQSRKEKPQHIKLREKKRVSETEHELVVRIPRVVGFRPIVVEPKAVLIVFHVEDVRIAVAIGLYDAPSMPPSI